MNPSNSMNPTINPLEFISRVLKVTYRDLKQESQWYISLDAHQKQELQDPLLRLLSPPDDSSSHKSYNQIMTCNTEMIQSIQSLLQEKEPDESLLLILRDALHDNNIRRSGLGSKSFSSLSPFLSYGWWHPIQVLASTRLVTILIHLIPKVASCAPMAGTILHQITQSILSSIRSLANDDDDDDELDGGNALLDMESVYRTAAFYQGLLLNVMEPIVGMNVVCATIWRDMAELSVVLSSLVVVCKEERYRSDQQDIICNAIDRILALIGQGLDVVIAAAAAAAAITVDGGGDVNKRDKMGKLLKFFFLRLMQFIPLLDLKRDCGLIGSKLTRYLACIVEFKGIMLGKNSLVGQDVVLLLNGKVDLCLEKLLECRHTENSKCGFYESRTLRLLLRGNNRGSSGGGGSRFWIGKWCVLLDLLMDVSRRIATGTKVALSMNEWEDIEFICETLLWQTAPMCHDIVTAGIDLDLVSKTLDVMGSLFLFVERLPLGPKHGKCWRHLHHLLLRWMGGLTRDGHIHPLTFELVLAIVEVYTIQSFVRGQNGDCMNAKKRKSTKYYERFVRLISRLLFDARISRIHRRNIGIVLLRIMGVSCSMMVPLKRHTESILIDSFIRFLKNLKQDPPPNRKRKRSAHIRWQSLLSLIDIAPLIRCIFSKKILWSKLNSSTRKNLVDNFSELLLLGDENLDRKLQRIRLLMTRTPDLLYIVCSFLKACDNELLSKGNELLDILLLALSQDQIVERGNPIGFCRLVHCFISEMNNLTPRQQMLYMNAMSYLSSAKSSTKSKFGGALLSSVLHCALMSNNGTLASRIPSTFISLFNSNDPVLIIKTVFSMESFAIRVPPSHRDILPKCVPSHCQLLLQARLKGELYSFITGSISKGNAPKEVNQWRSDETKSLAKHLKLESLLIRSVLGSSTVAIIDDPHSNAIVLEHPKDPTKRAILLSSSQTQEIAMDDLREWRMIGVGPLHQILHKTVVRVGKDVIVSYSSIRTKE